LKKFRNVMGMALLKWRHNWIFSSTSPKSAWKNTIWPNHATSGHQYWKL